MNWDLWGWSLLTLMIWREARGEGADGMRAAGHVAWNRAHHNTKYLATVITKDAQFTSINPYKKTYDPNLDVWPSPTDQQFMDAMTIAHEITHGVSKDPTGGATHYRNPVTSISASFQEAINKGEIVFTVKIGRHHFYRPGRPVQSVRT